MFFTIHFLKLVKIIFPYYVDELQGIEIKEEGKPSSESRFDKLTAMSDENADKPNDVNGNLTTGFMSSHAGELPPCVHDHDTASTLSHSVFDFQEKNWKLYYSNLCLKN